LCGDVALLCAPSPGCISESHFFDETQLNSATFVPLEIFLNFVFQLQMCRGFLAIGGDGGALDAPLIPHATALNSACRIEPQVPPTAKRAKHVVRRR